nr:MAG TPA: hypothetical protein [Caudoviricetes sp.]
MHPTNNKQLKTIKYEKSFISRSNNIHHVIHSLL